MRRSMLGVLAVLACVPALQALDDPRDKPKPTQAKPTKPATPAEELQALREEFDKSQQGAVQAFRKGLETLCGLLAIPTLACIQGTCTIDLLARSLARFYLRWRKE